MTEVSKTYTLLRQKKQTVVDRSKINTAFLRIPTARIFPSSVSGLMGFPVLSNSLHSPCTPMVSSPINVLKTETYRHNATVRYKH